MKKNPEAAPKTETEVEVSVDDARPGGPGDDNDVPAEYGGPRGKEPTRYGDWERNGRCIDF